MEETQTISAPEGTTELAIETLNLERASTAAARRPCVRWMAWTWRSAPASSWAIKGRSGSGVKTTLLNCISGLDQPTAGTVHVYGQRSVAGRSHAATTWRREQVGFISSRWGCCRCSPAYENVETGAAAQRREWQATPRCHRRGAGTGWADQVDRPPPLRTLRRAAAAAAIARTGAQPRLLIADEPTGNLSTPRLRIVSWRALPYIVRERTVTMLMATHDTLADDYVDRIINLSDGRIISG